MLQHPPLPPFYAEHLTAGCKQPSSAAGLVAEMGTSEQHLLLGFFAPGEVAEAISPALQ